MSLSGTGAPSPIAHRPSMRGSADGIEGEGEGEGEGDYNGEGRVLARGPSGYELLGPEGGRSMVAPDTPVKDPRPVNSPTGTYRMTSFIQGRRVSLVASTVNVMNAILGSGILALPFVMSTCGVAVFLVLMVGMAIITDYSIDLLIKACRETGKTSYEDIGFEAFGKTGRILVACAIIMQNV